VLPDGDIPVCAMLGPVVLEVHWCREIMAFSCQPAEQLCERTATHLPSPHAGVAPVGHHRKWVHGHAHGAARRLPPAISSLVALPKLPCARAGGCGHG